MKTHFPRGPRATFIGTAFATCVAALALQASPALAEGDGRHEIHSPHRFAQLQERLTQAVARHGMAVVASASASQGAAARGVTIPGNAVVMVFRSDYAVCMLEASVPAGIEAPLRYYLVENPDGTSTLSWRTPSATFAPYRSTKLDELARELDPVFEAIARDAGR